MMTADRGMMHLDKTRGIMKMQYMKTNSAEPRPKFSVLSGVLTVIRPFHFDERQADEEQFLKAVDLLMNHRDGNLIIDFSNAGSLSSMVIALCIAATRKADAAEKKITIKVPRRNSLAVRVSGLDKVLTVVLV